MFLTDELHLDVFEVPFSGVFVSVCVYIHVQFHCILITLVKQVVNIQMCIFTYIACTFSCGS